MDMRVAPRDRNLKGTAYVSIQVKEPRAHLLADTFTDTDTWDKN